MNTEEPIHIVHVVGKVVTGGVDAVVMNYYRHINRSKIQFDFIMDGYGKTPIDEEIIAMGGRIYKVEPYDKNILKNFLQCYRIFKINHYQIVHAHLNTLSVFPLLAATLAGVKIRIAHSHSTAVKSEYIRTAAKYMLRPFATPFSTHYCACSAYAGKWLFGMRSFQAGKIRIIPNAIEIERFSFDAKTRSHTRSLLNLGDAFVVGHVGRFMYQKNHDFVIDIFQEIYNKCPNSLLLLVGSGELEGEIRDKVKYLGLDKSVRFLGVRFDVPQLLQAMDVMLFPSRYEGLGLVTIEAQAAGLPVIVSQAVPAEAKATDLLYYCTLKQPSADWAKAAIAITHGNVRHSNTPELYKAGLDINQSARELAVWYEQLFGECNTGQKTKATSKKERAETVSY